MKISWRRINLIIHVRPWREPVSWGWGLWAFFIAKFGFFFCSRALPIVLVLLWIDPSLALHLGTLVSPLLGIGLYCLSPGIGLPFRSARRRIGLRYPSKRTLKVSLVAYAIIMFLCAVVTPIWATIIDRLEVELPKHQSIVQAVMQMDWGWFGLYAIIWVLVVPIFEELLFRRGFYGILRPAGAWIALILTSLEFACNHDGVNVFPAIFIIGLGLQLVYLYTRNLFASMITHALINFTSLVIIVVERLLGLMPQ